ncbi:hypothetical protein J2X69_000608 [Algoriphagus sp. 4150]|nr:hypothetical protein [Algoriphagus sp. 4150]
MIAEKDANLRRLYNTGFYLSSRFVMTRTAAEILDRKHF